MPDAIPVSRLPADPPPLFGLNTHRSRIEHKVKEVRYFYGRLLAKEIRYRKLAKQQAWSNAHNELEEWMFCASAFISATRSTYFYLRKSTKANSDNGRWLSAQERLPIHEIGTQLRNFMLKEAAPDAGYTAELPAQRLGEPRGDWVVRGIFQEPRNPRIAISIAQVLPHLSPGAAALAASHETNITDLFAAIFKSVEQLVSGAEERGVLSDGIIGPGVSTTRGKKY